MCVSVCVPMGRWFRGWTGCEADQKGYHRDNISTLGNLTTRAYKYVMQASMHICITECRRVQPRWNAWPDCLQSTGPSWVILDHFYDGVGVSYRLPVMMETIPASLTDSQSPCTALMAALPLSLGHLSWYFVCTTQTHVAVKPLHWSHIKCCMVNTWCPEPNSTRSDHRVQMLNHYCHPITSLSISDPTRILSQGMSRLTSFP